MNLMWSTAVSIVGNVLSTSLICTPGCERRVALRIERLGLRHAAGHPQHDDGIGGRRQARRAGAAELAAAGACEARQRGLAAGERRERRGRGRAHEPAAADRGVDASFFGGQSGQLVRLAWKPCPGPSVNQLEFGLHQHRPQQIRKSSGDGRPPRAGSRERRLGDAAFGRRRRAAERVHEHAIDSLADGRQRRRRPAAAAAAPAAAGDPCSGSASKTKNRSAGFSVEPISLRGFSSAMLPRKRVKPRPAMS